MKVRTVTRCAACGRHIRRSEPDLMLTADIEAPSPEKPRFYHTRCGEHAYAAVMAKPALYVLTVRHVDELEN